MLPPRLDGLATRDRRAVPAPPRGFLWLLLGALAILALIVAALQWHLVAGALVILWVVWIFDLARRRTKSQWST